MKHFLPYENNVYILHVVISWLGLPQHASLEGLVFVLSCHWAKYMYLKIYSIGGQYYGMIVYIDRQLRWLPCGCIEELRNRLLLGGILEDDDVDNLVAERQCLVGDNIVSQKMTVLTRMRVRRRRWLPCGGIANKRRWLSRGGLLEDNDGDKYCGWKTMTLISLWSYWRMARLIVLWETIIVW